MSKGFLRVACLQLQAFDLLHSEEALGHALAMVDQAAREKPDLLVLPECAYPAYYLDGWEKVSLRPWEEILAIFGERARRHALEMVVGLAELYPTSPAYNSSFYLDAGGRVRHRARKQFLWHFDSRWFTPGNDLESLATPYGTAGLFICADGRVPEITRTLALQGSRIFLNSTNWVSSGGSWDNLPNPQADYLMRVRSLENNAWIVSANKVGIEQDAVVYCGKSQVTSPEGKVVAIASNWKPEVLTYDIPLEEGTGLVAIPDGLVDGRLDIKKARRPETYTSLSLTTPEPSSSDRRDVTPEPADSVRQEPFEPPITTAGYGESPAKAGPKAILAAAVQLSLEGGERALARVEDFLRKAQVLGADLVLFPETEVKEIQPAEETGKLERVLELSRQYPFLIGWVGVEGTAAEGLEESQGKAGFFRTARLLHRGRVLGRYRKVHLERDEEGLFLPGDEGYHIIETPVGRVGFLLGYEGLLPEVPRALTLQGADIILWPVRFSVNRQHLFARARAMENRVFVVATNALLRRGRVPKEDEAESLSLGPEFDRTWSGGGSLIVGPGGQALAEALAGRPQIITATLQPIQARFKGVVPGTDVLVNRRPVLYQEITRGGRV
ncbi:MAG: carbon-nitrogen hydrolase family protein [Firmicutes bacterium]|nr:carbon-nitrogen hydrolase family protein [Bacillota bacterium]